MSHFSVGIIVPAEQRPTIDQYIEKQMAPFEEQLDVAFEDEEDDLCHRYETESTGMIKDPDTGNLYLPWDERFRVPGTFGTGGGSHKAPEGWPEVQVPFKERYATFEEWARNWCGYDGPDPECGRYGRWHNPNAKWDWYRVGGRWDGWITDNEQSSEGGFNFGGQHETVENNIATVESALERNKIPFAILTPDGEWHEQGEMGWWGIVRDEKDGWPEEAKTSLAKYSGHSIVIVDAHI